MKHTYMKMSQIKKFLPGAEFINFPKEDFEIKNFITDSRIVNEGDFFIALKGDKFNAHDFLGQVKKKKAIGCLVSEKEKLPKNMPAIVVEDTLIAMQMLAKKWRNYCGEHNLKYLALITGSNGKTTVKGMIASIFHEEVGEQYSLSTAGNLNNEIGLPLTLLRLNLEHKLAVIELGMNHPGETQILANIANPDIVLINNAQREHQEFMSSVDSVAKEHSLAIKNMKKNGVAILPLDSDYYSYWEYVAGDKTIFNFGFNELSNVTGKYIDIQNNLIEIYDQKENFEVNLNILGKHNLLNSLAATSVALNCGVTTNAIKRGLEKFLPVNGRMQQYKISEKISIINDTYNANPDSVIAAIDVLSSISKNSLLILGDMGEVGDRGQEFHREIGEYAFSKGIKKLLTIGTLSKSAFQVYFNNKNYESIHFNEIEDLEEELIKQIDENEELHILIKGSRFMRLERLLEKVINL